MANWRLVYTKQAQKDAKRLVSSGLKANAERLLRVIAEDPFRMPPPYEVLVGNLRGAISRRINIQHRLVYQVLSEEHIVKVDGLIRGIEEAKKRGNELLAYEMEKELRRIARDG